MHWPDACLISYTVEGCLVKKTNFQKKKNLSGLWSWFLSDNLPFELRESKRCNPNAPGHSRHLIRLISIVSNLTFKTDIFFSSLPLEMLVFFSHIWIKKSVQFDLNCALSVEIGLNQTTMSECFTWYRLFDRVSTPHFGSVLSWFVLFFFFFVLSSLPVSYLFIWSRFQSETTAWWTNKPTDKQTNKEDKQTKPKIWFMWLFHWFEWRLHIRNVWFISSTRVTVRYVRVRLSLSLFLLRAISFQIGK